MVIRRNRGLSIGDPHSDKILRKDCGREGSFAAPCGAEGTRCMFLHPKSSVAFDGSVYDRHCPAGASVMVSSPGCRGPTSKRCLISTRSVQRTKQDRGITPGPRWVASQSVPKHRVDKHASVLHCTLSSARRGLWHRETRPTLPPASPVSLTLKTVAHSARNVLPPTPSVRGAASRCSITRGDALFEGVC